MFTLTVFFIEINVKEIDTIYEFVCLEKEWMAFKNFENIPWIFQDIFLIYPGTNYDIIESFSKHGNTFYYRNEVSATPQIMSELIY